MAAQPRGPLAPGLLGRAANVARWYPEVLMTLGAPDLESHYQPVSDRMVEHPHGRVYEVLLRSRIPAVGEPRPDPSEACAAPGHPAGAPVQQMGYCPAAAQRPCAPSSNGAETLVRLESLACSIEQLAARLSAVPSPLPSAAAAPSERPQACVASEETTSLAVSQREPSHCSREQAKSITFLHGQQKTASTGPLATVPFDCIREETEEECRTSPQSGASQPKSGRKTAAEKEKDRTPRSARGEKQVRQGTGEGENPTRMGRSRPAYATDPNLSIDVTKEDKLMDAPMSPKMGPRQVWGRSSSKATASTGLSSFRSPEDTKERIHNKLQKLFGDPTRRRSSKDSVGQGSEGKVSGSEL